MLTGFFLHLAFEPLNLGEHFAVLLHRVYPRVARVVVDKGDVVAASAELRCLSRSPYVQVDYVEEAFACGALLWEWESMLFAIPIELILISSEVTMRISYVATFLHT